MKAIEAGTAKVNFDKGVKVELTLKELVTILAVFGKETTRGAKGKVRESGFTEDTFEFESETNDVPYTIYKDAKRILKGEGVEVR